MTAQVHFRWYVLLVLSVIISLFFSHSLLAVSCVIPNDGGVYSSTIILCSGEYRLPSGIIMSGDDTALNCQNTVLLGNGSGVGITITAKNVFIDNTCMIYDYETSIAYDFGTMKDSNSQNIAIVENQPISVSDPSNLSPVLSLSKPLTNDTPNSIPSLPNPEQQPNELPEPTSPLDDSLQLLGIDDTNVIMVVNEKSIKKTDTGLLITTSIPPQSGMYMVYEVVPKSAVPTASDLRFLDHPFTTVLDDPAKILLNVDLGNGLRFTYQTPTFQATADTTPSTIVTNETLRHVLQRFPYLEQTTKRNRILAIIVLLFFLTCYHFERRMPRKKKELFSSR